MVDMYARFNINRVSLDSDAEDQRNQDLYIFLELLTHVMSKEVLDLSCDGEKSSLNCINTLTLYLIFMYKCNERTDYYWKNCWRCLCLWTSSYFAVDDHRSLKNSFIMFTIL